MVSLELAALALLMIVSWIAGAKAAKLLYAPSVEKLHVRARKMLWWAGYVTIAACASAGVVVYVILTMEPVFWWDRAFLHLPLIGVPVLLMLFAAVPNMALLYRATQTKETEPPNETWRVRASRPALVTPYQLVPLGALATLYFALVPPVPFHWLAVAVPVVLFLLLSCGLWLLQERRSDKAGRPEPKFWLRFWAVRLLRNAFVLAAAVAIAWPFFLNAMKSSRLPAEFDMMTGTADYGGGPASMSGDGHGHAAHAMADGKPPVSVASLTGPRDGIADRQFTLTAEKQTVRLSSGKQVDAWTYNGQIPGPEIRVKQGELVEVKLVNKDIEDGVTIHWHGLDVPNAEDGVAGVTQNAVMPGETYTYRFVAEQAGTFWYHSHQFSKEAVHKGLFGALIVEPRQADGERQDIAVVTHVWDGAGFAIGASDTIQHMAIAPGTPVRLRLINTDDWVRQTYTLVGTDFRVAAIDGTDLNEPGLLRNTRLELLTGGRYDITFTMPDGPVYLNVGLGGKLGLFMSPDGEGDVPAIPATVPFEPQRYGSRTTTPFDADSKFDREFTMILDNKLGFYNGQFNGNNTINGDVFPNTPMYIVREGDLVKTTFVNRSLTDHPMHLHGHHMLVLSRNGKPVTGSPWWSDTLDVAPGETYVVAFRADNPGVWMDHCHNLEHAAAGMTMHLMYEGVTTPYKVGTATSNHPE